MLKKNIVIIFFFISIQPLSAQTDSGWIKCKNNFKNFVISLDTLNENQKTINDLIFKNHEAWKECISLNELPMFKSKTNNNDTFDMSKNCNEIILMNFWSLNCPPCMSELEILIELKDEFKGKKIKFISVCPQSENNVRKKLKMNFTTIYDGQDIFDLFGISEYPETFLIDKNHKIKHIFTGAQLGNNEKLKANIRSKLKSML